ncbi:MAG TPA: hypothetical protein VKA62_08510, partial [Agromyces sp.]|nr:hypothetical protein [Agromyces sp.]
MEAVLHKPRTYVRFLVESGMQIDHPTGHAEGDRIASGDVGRTPYAMAQEGLSELISASVRAQRIEAMNAAMRVDLIVLTVNYAMRSEEAFV